MRTLNIFALLLLVSFANTNKTNKMTSLSDVAQSFVQLHDIPAEGMARLTSLQESFQDSHKNLEGLVNINTDTCNKLNEANTNVLAEMNKRIKQANEEKEHLAEENQTLAATIKEDREQIQAENEKIKAAQGEIRNESTTLAQKESELEETINVLLRLKNIAQDELAGNAKITTEMGKYKVVDNYSFIQKSNLKEELKALLRKNETSSKALISSLIMMAANDDGRYSDPALVNKIMNTLDKIIKSNVEKKTTLKTNYENNVKNQREIIENCNNLIQTLTNSMIRDTSNVEINNRQNLMLNREIEGTQRYITRRTARAQFQKTYCDNQLRMMDVYQKRYAEVSNRINEMRSELGA